MDTDEMVTKEEYMKRQQTREMDDIGEDDEDDEEDDEDDDDEEEEENKEKIQVSKPNEVEAKTASE
jgi:nucleosome assembly protein 1-like 1